MRLINVHTKDLEEFFESEIPAYAILSHKWSRKELTYKEVLKRRADQSKHGYKKLLKACKIACDHNLDYLWIDTCCIDKKSSAELSEAINSMYHWYESSAVCLVLLEDFEYVDRSMFTLLQDSEGTFRRSVWFTRAWTLQELIAPPNVEFFDAANVLIGNKIDLGPILEDITGIDSAVLRRLRPLWKCAVAERMAWASSRVSTRPEDIAYSLMGIFDVHIPLLYGERGEAFARLQEAIIRRSADPTILLWGIHSTANNLFARSPSDFAALRGLKIAPRLVKHFNLTNVGLEMEAILTKCGQRVYGLSICNTDGSNVPISPNARTGHYLLLLRQHRSRGTMYRAGVLTRHSRTNSIPWYAKRSFVLSRMRHEQELQDIDGLHSNRLGLDIPIQTALHIESVEMFDSDRCSTRSGYSEHPPFVNGAVWEHSRSFVCEFFESTQSCAVRILSMLPDKQRLHIDLGFDFDCNPCAFLHSVDDERCIFDLYSLSSEAEEFSIDTGLREQKLTSTMDVNTGKIGYFFRSTNDEDVFATMPEALVPGPHAVWIGLVPPRLRGTDFWTFRIVNVKPRLLNSGILKWVKGIPQQEASPSR